MTVDNPIVPADAAHRLVEQQARATPDAIAVRSGERSIRYDELDRRANQLARHLQTLGVGPDVVVALCLSRSPEMVISVLAILKAGGAYLPLDPAYPAERIRFMLDDSQTKVVVTEPRLMHLVDAPGLDAVLVDQPSYPDSVLEGGAGPNDLAYVIYTSGSTGRPKGVMVEHRGLMNYLGWAREAYGTPGGNSLLHSPLSFDFTVTLLFGPLLQGGTIVMVPDGEGPTSLLDTLLGNDDLGFVKLTPAHLELLSRLASPDELKGRARVLVLGGEQLYAHQVRPWLTADDRLTVVNEYGPTETVVGCATYVVPRDLPDGPVPIGRPIANTRLHVLDEGGQPVDPGAVGELYIGGAGVARGYLGQPELTAERFVPDRFDDTPGARLYRSGDLARWRDDGELEFLGRSDDQVKVRGHRIEPGEIEVVLAGHADVGEAVVVTRTDAHDDVQLVAYVTASGERTPSPGDLRRFLARKLPAHMVPAAVVVVGEIPLSPNGKVDRKALPAADPMTAADVTEHVPPRNDVERRLAAIWESVIGVRPIGVRDEFWDLGASSLTAARLFAAIDEAFPGKLPVAPVFEAPTIERLAQLLGTGQRHGRGASLETVQRGHGDGDGARTPLFCVHGGAGTVLHLRDLAGRLGRDQSFYGFQARGLYGGARPLRTVEAMAAHYLGELRSVQPHGPYRLLGYCFGGVIVHEMARQLLADGEEIELLGLIGTVASPYSRLHVAKRHQRHALLGIEDGPPAVPAVRVVTARDRIARQRAAATHLGRVQRAKRLAAAGRRFVVTRLDQRTRGLRLRLALRLRLPVSESLRDRFFRINHMRANGRYAPGFYPGRVVLWVGEGVDDRLDLGWDGLVGELDIQVFAGAHEAARDLTMEPSVGPLAELIAAELDALDQDPLGAVGEGPAIVRPPV